VIGKFDGGWQSDRRKGERKGTRERRGGLSMTR